MTGNVFGVWQSSRPGGWRNAVSIRVVVPPTTEPISIEDARAHLRLDATGSPLAYPDDDWITSFAIPTAREWCETYTGRALAPQTIELARNGFPPGYSDGVIELPMPPVISIESVSYTDADGATLVVDPVGYSVDAYATPALLYAWPTAATWPTARDAPASVRVRYTAGYSVAGESPSADVPLPVSIRHAMLMLVAHFYENREPVNVGNLTTELEFTVKSLLMPYRITFGMA